MLPLQSVAMGLVVVVLVARLGGVDALPDPLGWALVLHGTHRLAVAHRRTLLGLAGLALVVSAVVWLPSSQAWLDDHDEALRWAANLPQLGYTALLCHVLAARASEYADGRAASWLRTALVLLVGAAVLPVLVFGGGLVDLEVFTYVAATLTLLLLIWLLFAYAGRPWTGTARVTEDDLQR